MTPTFNIAMVGATGAVGEVLLEVLQERRFPVNRVYPLSSARSVGKKIRFAGQSLAVEDLAEFDFSQVQIAFFSAGASVSSEYVPKAVQAGCVCIDNTSHFRYEKDVPLVVPEVNRDAIADYHKRGIIANPNCSTIQMLVALKPIHDAVGIKRINVATYQSVAGAGRQAIAELAAQTTALLSGKPAEHKVLPTTMAFNVFPQIDVMLDNGYSKEEMKMVWETQKILDPNISVNATAVRVAVFYGHSEAVHIETKKKITTEQAIDLLSKAPGVKVLSDKELPTPVTHGANSDLVFVARVREDISHRRGLSLWVVADNIRKGAATNAVQIAEDLIANQFYS